MMGVFSFGLIFVLHHRETLGALHTTVTYHFTAPNCAEMSLLTFQKNQWNLSKPARVLHRMLLSALTFCVQPGGDVYSRVVLHSSHGANWFPHGAGGARSDDQ